MPQSMIIPREWLAEADVENFKPMQLSFRCDEPEAGLFAIADIEAPLRFSDYPLSANGFDHDRMVRLLIGIRDNVSLPRIYIFAAESGNRRYRVRCGVHRYYASRTLGFSSTSGTD